MRCSKCGYSLSQGAKFCPECGAKTEVVASSGPLSKKYRNSRLVLEFLFADIAVRFNNTGETSLTIEGSEEAKSAIEFEVGSGVVYLTGSLPDLGRPAIHSYSSSDNRVKVNGVRLNQAHRLKVEISLPWIAAITVKDSVFGSLKLLGETGGLEVVHHSPISIENLATIGDLAIFMHAQGDFDGGNTKTSLSCHIASQGGVSLENVAGEVTTTLSDQGGLSIESLIGQSAKFSLTGMGSVEIEEGRVGTLTVDVTDMGGFEFSGHADVGSFKTAGMGDIEVDSCTRVIRKIATDMGDIEIG